MTDEQHDRPHDTRPGEKGPPAWRERTGGRDAPMPDEPPDSSSEVDQVIGLPPRPPPTDTDTDGDPAEPTDGSGADSA